MKTNTSKSTIDPLVKEQNAFSPDQYEKLMKGYEPLNVIGQEWEKRGDSYVQYSAYDESLTCISTVSLNLIP